MKIQNPLATIQQSAEAISDAVVQTASKEITRHRDNFRQNASTSELARTLRGARRSAEPGSIEEKIQSVFTEQFSSKASDQKEFHALIKEVFGENYSFIRAEAYRRSALGGEFNWLPPIRFASSAELNQAAGAYSDTTGVAFINSRLKNNIRAAGQAFVEQVASHLNAKLTPAEPIVNKGKTLYRLLNEDNFTCTPVANHARTSIKREGSKALRAVGGFIGRGVELGIGEVKDFATMGTELSDLRTRCETANTGEAVKTAEDRKFDNPEKAKEFWTLTQAVYHTDEPTNSKEYVGPPEGYVEVEKADKELGVSLRDEETGLKAHVYYNKKEDLYVLVFEGTTTNDNGADWGPNVATGAGGVPKQHRQGLDIALRFKEVYGKDHDIAVTGHSLGGGIATFAGVGAGIETYTYNPSGLGPGSRAYLDSMGLVGQNGGLVKNYVQRGEILDLLRNGQIAGAIAVAVTNPFLAPIALTLAFLSPWSGSGILVGETEHVGQYGISTPVTEHGEMDL